MIWLSVNFDVFIKNLLRLSYEKILLLTSVNLRGDYPMTLGLILLLGVTSLIATNNATYRLTDNMGKVQENSRFLKNLLNKDLRMVGYKGCATRQNITITNTLKNSSDLAYNFSDDGLVGYDNLSATLPDELNTQGEIVNVL